MTPDQLAAGYERLQAQWTSPGEIHYREWARAFRYHDPVQYDQGITYLMDNHKGFRFPLIADLKSAIADLGQRGELKEPKDPISQAEQRFFEIWDEITQLPANKKKMLAEKVNASVNLPEEVKRFSKLLATAAIKSETVRIYCAERGIESPV